MLKDGVEMMKVGIYEYLYLLLLNVEVVDCGLYNSFLRVFMWEGICGYLGK